MAKKESRLSFPVQRLSQEVDRLFDELIHRPWAAGRTSEEDWSPQLDLYETNTAFILDVDLPGVKKQEVSVAVEKGNLILQGRRSFGRSPAEEHFYCRERRAGHFARHLRLPGSINQDQIHAEFHNGILRVTLPKLAEDKDKRG
ncbi:MAG: Hsp20/alpha crystallin family protein [Deltaproteobacteria bacterium]|nr:Hsp20/alpha crystallin family protein [Deltaproteobacteria bacterium]